MSELAKELKAIQRANYKAKIEAIVAQHKGLSPEIIPPKPVVESVFAFDFEDLENGQVTASKRKRKKGKKTTVDIPDVEKCDNAAIGVIINSKFDNTTTPIETATIPSVTTAPTAPNVTVNTKGVKLVDASFNNKQANSKSGAKQNKSSSTKNNKQKIEQKSNDDEMEFLNQTLKQLEIDNAAKQELLKKQELEKKKINQNDSKTKGKSVQDKSNKSTSKIKFISPNDPTLTTKMKMKVKYGDGNYNV